MSRSIRHVDPSTLLPQRVSLTIFLILTALASIFGIVAHGDQLV